MVEKAFEEEDQKHWQLTTICGPGQRWGGAIGFFMATSGRRGGGADLSVKAL